MFVSKVSLPLLNEYYGFGRKMLENSTEAVTCLRFDDDDDVVLYSALTPCYCSISVGMVG